MRAQVRGPGLAESQLLLLAGPQFPHPKVGVTKAHDLTLLKGLKWRHWAISCNQGYQPVLVVCVTPVWESVSLFPDTPGAPEIRQPNSSPDL